MAFTKPKKSIGIDLGNHSVKVVQLSKYGKKIYIEEVGFSQLKPEMVNIDPVRAQTDALTNALEGIDIKQSLIVSALSGNTTVVRYPKIIVQGKETTSSVIEREAAQYIPFDLNDVQLTWDVIDQKVTENGTQVEVLLVAAKKESIQNLFRILQNSGIHSSVFDIDSIAVFNAVERCGFLKENESTAIFDIGYASSSIHFVRDRKSVFIRDLLWGAKDLVDAIVREQKIEFSRAEQELIKFSKEQKEKIKEIPEAVELKEEIEEAVPIEEVPISPLEPLEEEIMYEEVEKETVKPTPTKKMNEILLQPLNRLVGEVRKSFDFYEHQLYEKPVQRVILCGGVVNFPMIGETIVEEFNVETVEVPDFTTSDAIAFSHSKSIALFKENSAQFAVALGLAIRGLMEI